MSEPIITPDYAFELSTEAKPPALFTVDGDEYAIVGMEHMSKAQEASVTALFARHSRLSLRLESAKPETAQKIGEALYDIRISLLTTLTTLPKDVCESLPRSAQVQLMGAVAKETGAETDVDGLEEKDDAGDDID